MSADDPLDTPLLQILDDMRENQRRLEELALFDHPDLSTPAWGVRLASRKAPEREWCPRCLTTAQLRVDLGIGTVTFCTRCDDYEV